MITRTEEAGRPKYKFLPRQQASEKCGLPIYPGVEEVLLVEEGNPHGTTTLLFDTDAPVEQVARYYRQKLGQGRRVYLGDRVPSGWTCDTYRVRGRRIGLNLLRIREENRTSVLLISARVATKPPSAGVLGRWLAGSV